MPEPTNTDSSLRTPEQAAPKIRPDLTPQAGARYLERLRSSGGGPVYVKFGRKVFYTDAALAEFIASRQRRSTSAA